MKKDKTSLLLTSGMPDNGWEARSAIKYQLDLEDAICCDACLKGAMLKCYKCIKYVVLYFGKGKCYVLFAREEG